MHNFTRPNTKASRKKDENDINYVNGCGARIPKFTNSKTLDFIIARYENKSSENKKDKEEDNKDDVTKQLELAAELRKVEFTWDVRSLTYTHTPTRIRTYSLSFSLYVKNCILSL